jgi:predicted nucleic acid-binding protein
VSVVIDASTMVAALLNADAAGRWARDLASSGALVAPQLLAAEVASTLRRHVLTGALTATDGALALEEMSDLAVDLVPFDPLRSRVWALRETVSTYDAWYVATAEHLGVPLATVDRRLTRANGPRCEFLTPGQTPSSEGRSL